MSSQSTGKAFELTVCVHPTCQRLLFLQISAPKLIRAIEGELDLLEAIYFNELTVTRAESGHPDKIHVVLHPATGDNVEEQFVCLTLEFILPPEYPHCPPDILMRNSRGLADEHITSLRQQLHSLADERTGNPMLYELIELAKESLTQGNIPHGQCVICLEDFCDSDIFTKTECYHYFHVSCLVRYIHHSILELDAEKAEAERNKVVQKPSKGVVCPVCREPIRYDLVTLEAQQPPTSPVDERIVLSDEIRHLQKKMAAMFRRQQAKGGIIDVEAERNKHLIVEGEMVVSSNLMENGVTTTSQTASTAGDSSKPRGKAGGKNDLVPKGGRPGLSNDLYPKGGRPSLNKGGFKSRTDRERDKNRDCQERNSKAHIDGRPGSQKSESRSSTKDPEQTGTDDGKRDPSGKRELNERPGRQSEEFTRDKPFKRYDEDRKTGSSGRSSAKGQVANDFSDTRLRDESQRWSADYNRHDRRDNRNHKRWDNRHDDRRRDERKGRGYMDSRDSGSHMNGYKETEQTQSAGGTQRQDQDGSKYTYKSYNDSNSHTSEYSSSNRHYPRYGGNDKFEGRRGRGRGRRGYGRGGQGQRPGSDSYGASQSYEDRDSSNIINDDSAPASATPAPSAFSTRRPPPGFSDKPAPPPGFVAHR